MADGEMTFPTLKIPEIVSCSEELRVPMTEDDIKNPQPQVIRKVLEMYLELFLNLNADDIRQPTFEAMMIDYPQLHEDSVPLLVKNAAMGLMLRACGIMDFSMHDVIKPQSKRIKKILSAIINFAKFREMQMASIDQLLEERDVLLNEQAVLEQDVDQKALELQNIRNDRAAEAPRVAQLEEDCKDLLVKITELNNEQAGLQGEVRAIKDEITDVSDQASKVVFEVQSVQQECNQMRSQIVQSPERIKKEIVRMGTNVEQEKAALAAAEHRARDLAHRVETVNATHTDLEKCCRSITDVGSEMEKLKDAKQEIDVLQEEISSEKQQLKDLAAAEQQLKRQIAMTQDRILRTVNQYDMKRDASAQSIETTRKERERLAAERQKNADMTKENQIYVQQVNEKISEARSQHAVEMRQLRSEHSGLLQQIQRYHTDLENAMLTN